MGKKWIFFVFAVAVVMLVYVFSRSNKQPSVDDSVVIKKPNQKQNTKAPEPSLSADKKRSVAAAPVKGAVGGHSPNPVLDPLENPFVGEKKTRNKMEGNWFGSVQNEKRENLNIQLIGTDTWSVFSELQVSKDSIHNPLFSFGPYQVARKENQVPVHAMNLVYNENQHVLGVLTGRVVVKMRDLYDMDPVARDHGLKIETVSTSIRTAYLNASHLNPYRSLNEALKNDQRIERFYFEVVRADLARN